MCTVLLGQLMLLRQADMEDETASSMPMGVVSLQRMGYVTAQTLHLWHTQTSSQVVLQ